MVQDIHRSIEAVWRIEQPRLIAGLARLTRGDVGLAEELAQDALVAALEQWPESGVPVKPGAWLMATAKHRAIDQIRRGVRFEQKQVLLGHEFEIRQESITDEFDASVEDDIGDDLLRLVLISCHPILSVEARVALTLRLLGGLSTPEIARAFFVPESTVAQRVVRAKRTLTEAKIPFEVPVGAELVTRLSSVLQVIYLIFNEGYSATSGTQWMRPELCEDAMRLGRILVGLMPGEPEVHGLLALMELQASRMRARVNAFGEPVLLLDQDRGRWDFVLIQRGLAALDRAEQLGGLLGPYRLQAAIAACHARARTAGATDWGRIAALYDALAELTPSPVIELNRAVAVAMAYGPEAGLDLIDQLTDVPALKGYAYLPSARADLLEKLGRLDEARTEYLLAAELNDNVRERELLLARAAGCHTQERRIHVVVVQTERLVIRRLRQDDLDDFAYLTSHPDVIRHMDSGEPMTRDETQKWLDITLENYRVRGWGCFGITLIGDDRLIGFAGFARPPYRPGIIELLYALDPRYWGRGYATEAAAAIVRFGFEECGMTRIEATVNPPNLASRHVLEKIGMTHIGQLQDGSEDPAELFVIEPLL
jgi:RNA polymerase sigma factor (sigma-70 family)